MMKSQQYHNHIHGTPVDEVLLSYEDRFLRRKVLTTTKGKQLLVDLPQTTSLEDGGVLVTTEGEEILIRAAEEPLLAVAGDLPRLAWHIGNRHTPCQIEADRLLIQRDKVIAHMLAQLGAQIEEITAPFTPEGGAYGHGRTHAHEHGHSAHHAH